MVLGNRFIPLAYVARFTRVVVIGAVQPAVAARATPALDRF
jgi:hypothetical protein